MAHTIRPIISAFRGMSRPSARVDHTMISRRTIASQSVAQSRQYLIQVPDQPGTQATRVNTRQAHIEGCMHLIDSGELSYFGVTLMQHPVEGKATEINGSIMVLEAESESAVRDFLERDAYTRAGVWDIQKAKIWPFRAG